MDKTYQIFLSSYGEIVIKSDKSLIIFKIINDQLEHFFAKDDELHSMILFPIDSIPRTVWKHKNQYLIKLMSMK